MAGTRNAAPYSSGAELPQRREHVPVHREREHAEELTIGSTLCGQQHFGSTPLGVAQKLKSGTASFHVEDGPRCPPVLFGIARPQFHLLSAQHHGRKAIGRGEDLLGRLVRPKHRSHQSGAGIALHDTGVAEGLDRVSKNGKKQVGKKKKKH